MEARTLAVTVEKLGAGDILLNCIDKDDTNSGYELVLTKMIKEAVTIPVITSSWTGKVEHFLEVFETTDADAALAAGIFHRKEMPIAAVKEHLHEKGNLFADLRGFRYGLAFGLK